MHQPAVETEQNTHPSPSVRSSTVCSWTEMVPTMLSYLSVRKVHSPSNILQYTAYKTDDRK